MLLSYLVGNVMFELNDPKTLQISPLVGPFSRTSNLITQFVYKVAN